MNRVSDYLARAVEAETNARKATGPYRAQLRAIAEQWRELAQRALELAEYDAQLQRERPSGSEGD